MSPRLSAQTVEIGRDAYGRRVWMKRERIYDGKIVWTIGVDQFDQRDDDQRLSGLTDNNVRDMIDALKVISP